MKDRAWIERVAPLTAVSPPTATRLGESGQIAHLSAGSRVFTTGQAILWLILPDPAQGANCRSRPGDTAMVWGGVAVLVALRVGL